jgi:hypothetical protein
MEDLPRYAETCTECAQSYNVTSVDEYFLNKFSVPEPKRCPSCRERRRLLFLNMLNLFRRTCDATGAAIVSSYPPDSAFKVYSQRFWYSDAFDATVYGRSFDFSRPFFEQYAELARAVPRPALFTGFLQDENCDYTNHSAANKNCYMVFDTTLCHDVYYSYGIEDGRDSMECHRSSTLELCYEVLDSLQCYNCAYLQNCQNCKDSAFLLNCIGCDRCLLCSNLRQKSYHIYNKPVTPEEFERVRLMLRTRSGIATLQRDFAHFVAQFPRKFMEGMFNENVTGDYLVRCKNTFESYDCRTIQDGKYCTQSFLKSKDSYCTRELGDGELFYEGANAGGGYNLRFCWNCFQSVANLTYCDYCVNGAANLFGCVGLKGKKFSILNLPYPEDEYHILVDKITKHMQATGEWGQQPPASLAPFEYNISEAQHRYPLSKEEILKCGFRYREPDLREFRPAVTVVPDSIEETQDDITKALLACTTCKRNYKIIAQELALYRTLNLPLPECCFSCRNESRHSKRNPRKLYQGSCHECQEVFATTYAPSRTEKILCEKCYVESLE